MRDVAPFLGRAGGGPRERNQGELRTSSVRDRPEKNAKEEKGRASS